MAGIRGKSDDCAPHCHDLAIAVVTFSLPFKPRAGLITWLAMQGGVPYPAVRDALRQPTMAEFIPSVLWSPKPSD